LTPPIALSCADVHGLRRLAPGRTTRLAAVGAAGNKIIRSVRLDIAHSSETVVWSGERQGFI
jgi:hypothetical protein